MAFRGVQNLLVGAVDRVQEEIIENVESQLGYSITYRSLSPLILRSVEIRDVVIGSVDNPLVTVDRLTLKSRPLQLIGRPFAPRPIVTIEIIDTSIWLDAQRVQELQMMLQELTQQEGEAASNGQPPRMVIRFRNVTLSYQEGGTSYIADALDGTLHISEEKLEYQAHATVTAQQSLNLDQPFLSDSAELAGEVTLEGEYLFTNRQGNAHLQLQQMRVGPVVLHNQSFIVAHSEEELIIHNEFDHYQYLLMVYYQFADQALEVAFNAEQFIPLTLLQEASLPPPLLDLLRSSYTIEGSLIMNGDGDSQYTLRLRGNGVDNTSQSPLSINVDIVGNLSEVVVHELSMSANSGSVTLVGNLQFDPLLPQGEINFRRFAYHSYPMLDGAISINQSENILAVRGIGLLIGDYQLPRFQLLFNQSEISTELNFFVAFDATESETASVVASLQRSRENDDTILVVLNQVDPRTLINLASAFQSERALSAAAYKSSNYRLSTRISIAIAPEETRLNIPTLVINDIVRERPLLTLWGGGTTTALKIERIIVHGDELPILEGEIQFLQRDATLYDVRVALESPAYNYEFDLRYRAGQFVRIRGSYGVYGLLFLNDPSNLRYNIRSDPIPFQVMQREMLISLRSRGSYTTRDDWNIDNFLIELVVLSNVNSSTEPLQLTLRGYGSSPIIQINQVVLTNADVTTIGRGRIEQQANVWSLVIESTNSELGERYQLNAIYNVSSENLQSQFQVDNFFIDQLRVPLLKGRINSTLNVALEEQELSAQLSINGDGLSYNTIPIGLSSTVRYAEGSIQVLQLQVDHFDITVATEQAVANLEERSIELAMTAVQNRRRSILPGDPYEVLEDLYPLFALNITVEAQLSTPTEEEPLRLDSLSMLVEHSNKNEIQAQLSAAPLSEKSYRPLVFTLQRTNNRYLINGGYNDGAPDLFTGWIEDSSFVMEALDPLPINFLARGSISADYVDIIIQDITYSVVDAPRLVDLGFMRFSSGVATGDIHIVGDTNFVKSYGTLYVSDVRMELTYVPGEIGPTSSFVVLQGNEIAISRLYALVDGEYGAYFSARLILDGLQVANYQIFIETPEGASAPLKYDFGVVAVNATASGVMALIGQPGQLRLTGNIIGHSGTVILRTGSANRGVRLPERGVLKYADLNITAGEQLEMRWPSNEFPVLRAFPQSGDSISFQIPEGANHYELTGTITLRGGEVFYYDRSFLIREGSIVMNEISGRIDPLLNLRAEIRELASNGPVSIFLIIEDDFLSQLAPRLEAIPPLNQAEIARLLGSNIYDSESAASFNDADAAIQLAGDVLARLTILNDFENSLRSLLGFFDIFTIRTQIFQNIIIETLDINSSLYTTNVSSVARYFNNTNLFLGKYLADYLYAEILVGFRADETALRTSNAIGVLSVDTELAFELQSPLGVLRWKIEPQFASPFQIDSSLELSWSFSY